MEINMTCHLFSRIDKSEGHEEMIFVNCLGSRHVFIPSGDNRFELHVEEKFE
jgi:hypothetical protein